MVKQLTDAWNPLFGRHATCIIIIIFFYKRSEADNTLTKVRFVLSRGRSLLHLVVLEALYIRKLDPELCVQKENVLSLQLFGTVRREGAK